MFMEGNRLYVGMTDINEAHSDSIIGPSNCKRVLLLTKMWKNLGEARSFVYFCSLFWERENVVVC